MGKNSFLITSGDLLILFTFGASLCYFREDLLMIDAPAQLLTSLILSFVLGSFGPTPGEILEWILFFCLGIITVSFYPYTESLQHSNGIPITDMLNTLKQALLYSFELLAAWIVGIPSGYMFFKMSRNNLYRKKRY